ncbi:MAG TPA: hypothetical protein VFN11_12335, partial [Ktedonobacterales bacterium]|nr:hypothetical protein [Ktedonobacterales bacterium]
MIQAPEERRRTARAATTVSDAEPRRRSLARRAVWLGRLVRHYPLPFGVLALLLVSLGTWLAHLQTLVEWSLIAVILLGGIPL